MMSVGSCVLSCGPQTYQTAVTTASHVICHVTLSGHAQWVADSNFRLLIGRVASHQIPDIN